MHVSKTATLNEFIRELKEGSLRLTAPSLVSGSGKTLYMQKPVALERATRPNLDKALFALVKNGEELTVTDPLLESVNLALAIHFE
jgi:ubiquitin-activating enzyme E1 C